MHIEPIYFTRNPELFINASHKLETCNSIGELRACFQRFISSLGMKSFAYARISKKDEVGESLEIIHTYPKDWISRYKLMRYHGIDPAFDVCMYRWPLRWDTSEADTSNSVHARLFSQARSFGITRGFTLYVPNDEGANVICTFVCPDDFSFDSLLYPLQVTAQTFHNMAVQLSMREALEAFTPTEKEILKMKALGCANKLIAHRLALSPSSISRSIIRATRKIGTLNYNRIRSRTSLLIGLLGEGGDGIPACIESSPRKVVDKI